MKERSIRRVCSIAWCAVFICTIGLMTQVMSAIAESVKIAGTIQADDWITYRNRFVRLDGRVIDNANGDISHSEGQGYGLLLSLGAEDRGTFEKIWTFTLTEFLIRDDGLAVWKWDPTASPHVTDRNNATDGDILIAYALGLAGVHWNEERYLKAAQKIAVAIGKFAIGRDGDRSFLLPGVQGFDVRDRPDGPVISLSYWVFEAFPILQSLAPEYDWSGVLREGLTVLQQVTAGKIKFPSDWISIRAPAQPRTADSFPPEFGYNSLRIPLYLLRAGMADVDWLQSVNRRWKINNDGVAVVNVLTGEIRERLTEQGYVAISAALACALEGISVSPDLKNFKPELYYPATLYLLSMSLIREKYPKCL